MKHFGFLMLLLSFILGVFASCGGERRSEVETDEQSQVVQNSTSLSEKAVPSQNSINQDTLVDSNLELKNKTKTINKQTKKQKVRLLNT